MHYKLFILAAVGLTSLYMLHLLAMDYMKINKFLTAAGPTIAAAGRILLRGKRDINLNTNLIMKIIQKSSEISARRRPGQPILQQYLKNFNIENLKINWYQLLNNDPLGCLPSLICQIVSGAEKNSTEAQNIYKFTTFSFIIAPDIIRNAYNHGLIYLNESEKCYSEYPLCIYSAKTMLRILKWFIKFIA